MTIWARYPGKCAKCGGPIQPGEQINWDKSTKRTEHVTCPEHAEVPQATKTYRLSRGSGDGYRGWQQGQIVRASDRQREQGYPEWLYVLDASSKYYRYDGLSFGVGDDSGYVYTATCREATPEEVKVQAAKARLEEIKRDIQQRGEKPEASDGIARGERMFNTQTIYGGGDWFVVNDTEIWYVRNNGMDGDCWSANNVTTGGAGAIGRRIPRDETLVAELRELAEIVK